MPKNEKEKNNKLNSKENQKTDVTEKKSKITKGSAKSSNKTPTKTRTKKSSESKDTSRSKKGSLSTSTVAKETVTKRSAVSRKSSTSRSTRRSKPAKISSITTEYYDLPFRYNQTIVRILAQTPNTLFIYWDISDEDRQSFLDKYGANFFQHTKPYLVITNETMHYTFEVEINDFANSWYLHINDANCEYRVELGRKFIVDSNHDKPDSNTSMNMLTTFESYHINDYLYITSSNKIEVPNDHILFDKLGSIVFFTNVKTNITEQKNISSLSFLQKIGKVYNIYDLYKEIYHDELISDEFGVTLPSSSSSSTFK